MTTFPHARKGERDLVSFIAIKDFDVSWAGGTQVKDRFWLGSEDGRLLVTDLNGESLGPPELVAASSEAVNGVASIQRWVCVSTRSEVMIWTPALVRGERNKAALIPYGAHDVIAGAGGYFLAPLGRNGLLSCRPKDGPEQSVTISNSSTEEVYFYRVISLKDATGSEVVACATRIGGVAAMQFRGEGGQHDISTLNFKGLDVVDLCPLNYGAEVLGAVALGRDGTLILFRDVLHQPNPMTTRYETIRGTAYRVLSAGGYLFVLTTKGLYVIAGLVQRVFAGDTSNAVTPVLYLPMDAVDANLIGSEWVLIVTPDGLLRLDVALLDQHTPNNLVQGERQELRPNWISPDWTQREVALAAGA